MNNLAKYLAGEAMDYGTHEGAVKAAETRRNGSKYWHRESWDRRDVPHWQGSGANIDGTGSTYEQMLHPYEAYLANRKREQKIRAEKEMQKRVDSFNKQFGFKEPKPFSNEEIDKYLSLCKDESLAEHDKKYHPNGYKEGDNCKMREKMASGDKTDGELSVKTDEEDLSKMSTTELEDWARELEDDEWSEHKSDYCEAMGRPASEWDDSRSDFQDEIEEVLLANDDTYGKIIAEIEKRKKGA